MPCLIQEDRALRAAILSCQACCMLAVFLSMLVSYHFRRSKARHPLSCSLPIPKPHSLRGGSQGWGGGMSQQREGCHSPARSGGISLPWLHPLWALAEAPGCTLTPLSLQRIRASGVVLLEMILFGSLLLYFPVSIQPAPGTENLWAGV